MNELSSQVEDGLLTSPSLPFVVENQRVTVHKVDFVNKSIYLSTEIDVRIHFGNPGVEKGSIALNCRQIAILAVKINGEATTSFNYADPWTFAALTDEDGKAFEETPPRENAELSKKISVAAEATDFENNNGELWITNIVKPPVDEIMQQPGDVDSETEDNSHLEWRSVTIAIDYALEHPDGGIAFVLPRSTAATGKSETNEFLIARGAHLYTTSSASARDWLPCVDSPNGLCRWRLEFHIPPPLIAVSCGELVSDSCNDLDGGVTVFSLNMPVPAYLIGFAIGAFESVVDEHMNENQHFCPPGGIASLLESTTDCLQSVFEVYEEELNCSYPFSAYRQVFVHAPPHYLTSFASLSIISTDMLTTSDSIEGQLAVRRLHAEAVARQYFGCVVIAEPSPASFTSHLQPSWWLVPALARYVASLYARRAFGLNEHKSWVASENAALAEFEHSHLNGSALRLDGESSGFDVEPFADMAVRKGALLLRLVELKITLERLLHVLSVLLGKSTKREISLLTRADFVHNVSIVSGQQIGEFMNRFETSSCIRLTVRYVYSRRRSALQVTMQQQPGPTSYAGPVTVAIQEMDGHFTHVVQMSGRTVSVELPIHSKPKKTRKRHVVLLGGDEIDIDLTGADIDCIMLWLRVDPNFALLRGNSTIHQPDYSWQYQLELDRDVCGQLEAAAALKDFPTQVARARLESAVANDQFFYRVRCAAARFLTDNLILAATNATAVNNGIPVPVSTQPLISLFRRLFASRTYSQLPRPNNFSNIQSYFVQIALLEAIAACRSREALDFLILLMTYNDNSRNKFSDADYVGSMCKQLAECLPPSPSRASLNAPCQLTVSSSAGIVVSELVTRLNIDTLPSPTAGFVVSQACLSAIRHVQKLGYLPNNAKFFEPYVGFQCSGSKRCGTVFPELRIEAFSCLLDCILCGEEEEEEAFADAYSASALNLISNDEDFSVRFSIVSHLLDVAKKRSRHSERNRAVLSRFLPSDKLWNVVLLASDICLKSRLAALFRAIYFETNELSSSEDRPSSAGAVFQRSQLGSPVAVPKKKARHFGERSISFQHQAAHSDQSWNPDSLSMSLEDIGPTSNNDKSFFD